MSGAAELQTFLADEFANIKTMLGGKADASAIETLNGMLAGKASADALAELQGAQERLNARFDAWEEGKIRRPGAASGGGQKTMGELVWEHELRKAWLRKERLIGGLGAHGPVIQGRGIAVPTFGLEVIDPVTGGRKAVTIGEAEVGAWVAGHVRPTAIQARPEIIGRVDVVRMVTARQSSGENEGAPASRYQGLRETGLSSRAAVYAKLAAPVVASGGATATVTDATGFVPNATVKFHTASGVFEARLLTANTTTGVLTFTETLEFDAAADDEVTSNVFGASAESSQKPYGFFALEPFDEELKTIATILGITRQKLVTLPLLMDFLQNRMKYHAKRTRNWQMLHGDNSSNQLQGVFTLLGVHTTSWSDGDPGDNRIDCVLRAAEALRNRGFLLPYVSMCDRDWGKITRLKGDDGHYLSPTNGAISITNEMDRKAIGAIPVIIDNDIELSSFLVEDETACVVADQATAEFAVGHINAQFAHNELTARYEETVAQVIEEPDGIEIGEWDSAP